MVYTLTFNPALDYIIHVPDYQEGVVNRTKVEKILPGGKGINVSIVLKNLGVETTALGFVSGFTGEMILKLLAEAGVSCDFISLEKGFSRINVKIKSEQETEINGQGPEINKEAVLELYQKLESMQAGDILVLAGTAPKGFSDRLYADIMKKLQKKQVRIVVDATGSLLKNSLSEKPFLIKPNLAELEEFAGKKLDTTEAIIASAKELQKLGAENVLVSMGGDGAILLTSSGEVYTETAPQGTVVNTTGSGDSAVAGFLAKFIQTGDYQKALKFGVCAGSASAFSENLATEQEINQLYQQKE